jgi:hypothetical protein
MGRRPNRPHRAGRTATNNRGSGRPRPISASRSTTSPVPRHWCRHRCPTEAVHAEGVGGGGDPAVIGPARRSARRPPPPPARSADCGHSTGHAASHHTRSRRAGVVLWASEIGHLDDTGRTHWADILITRAFGRADTQGSLPLHRVRRRLLNGDRYGQCPGLVTAGAPARLSSHTCDAATSKSWSGRVPGAAAAERSSAVIAVLAAQRACTRSMVSSWWPALIQRTRSPCSSRSSR